MGFLTAGLIRGGLGKLFGGGQEGQEGGLDPMALLGAAASSRLGSARGDDGEDGAGLEPPPEEPLEAAVSPGELNLDILDTMQKENAEKDEALGGYLRGYYGPSSPPPPVAPPETIPPVASMSLSSPVTYGDVAPPAAPPVAMATPLPGTDGRKQWRTRADWSDPVAQYLARYQ